MEDTSKLSIITEQGDLGLGLEQITEEEQATISKK